MLREFDVESAEKEWEKCQDLVNECTNEVCGMRRVRGKSMNGSEWSS